MESTEARTMAKIPTQNIQVGIDLLRKTIKCEWTDQ